MDPLFYSLVMLSAAFVCEIFKRWLLASGRYRSSGAARLLSFTCLGGGLHLLSTKLVFPALTEKGGGSTAGDFFPYLLLFLMGIWGAAILEARARNKEK